MNRCRRQSSVFWMFKTLNNIVIYDYDANDNVTIEKWYPNVSYLQK